MDSDFRYEDSLWPKTDAKEFIFAEISLGFKVLDLGCWTGRLGEKLKKEKECFVVGVDVHKKALEIAKKRLDKVYLVDLDSPEGLKRIKDKFDFVILADVLEHLKNPSLLLDEVQKVLKPDGKLIVSVPNIANWWIRYNLLLGNFDYQETGILDRTHLRFWTRKSARELLKETGYFIEREYYSGASFLPELKAVQFIFVCKKYFVIPTDSSVMPTEMEASLRTIKHEEIPRLRDAPSGASLRSE